jgi:hypothetical protein
MRNIVSGISIDLPYNSGDDEDENEDELGKRRVCTRVTGSRCKYREDGARVRLIPICYFGRKGDNGILFKEE